MVIESIYFLDMIFFIPTSLSVKIVDDQLRDTNLRFIDDVNQVFIESIFRIVRDLSIKVAVITGDRQKRIELARANLKM